MLFQLLEKKNDRPVRILCLEAIYYLCMEKVNQLFDVHQLIN